MVKVIAHRGASGSYPENSREALEEAIRVGVDMVEIDLRFTKDRVPVLFHDKSTKRLLGQPGSIHDLTLDQWRQHRILGSGTPLSLADLFTLTDSRIPVILDIKEFGMEETISDLIDREGCKGNIIVSSFYSLIVRRFRKVNPKLRTALILDRLATMPFAAGLTGLSMPYLRWTGVSYIHMCYRPGNLVAARSLQAHGYSVAFWTVDDPMEFANAASAEPYGIMTNIPETILASVQR